MAGNDPRTQPAPTTPADDKSKATSRRTPPEQPAATQPNPPRPKALGGIDDLLPVGGFLTGKLISHVLLGAALGAVGSAVQLTPRTRATVQIVAGVVMLVLAPKLDVEASLPETGEIVLDLGTLKPGKLRFSCGMGMYSGSIQVT